MKRVDYNYDALSEYERGYIDALHAYAHWKDGVQYVGSTGRTLANAIEGFLTNVKSAALR